MLRFLLFAGSFVVGLVAGIILAFRRGGQSLPVHWELKYREIDRRYRELSRKLSDARLRPDPKVGLYRSLLYDSMHFMKHPDRFSPPEKDATIRAIEAALAD